MYKYIFIYVCIHIYIHIYMYIYTHQTCVTLRLRTWLYIYMFVYYITNIHACVYTCVLIYKYNFIYTWPQTCVTLRLCEGEAEFFDDNLKLGVFEISDIPPRPRGQVTIKVTIFPKSTVKSFLFQYVWWWHTQIHNMHAYKHARKNTHTHTRTHTLTDTHTHTHTHTHTLTHTYHDFCGHDQGHDACWHQRNSKRVCKGGPDGAGAWNHRDVE